MNTNLTKLIPQISILGNRIIWEGEGEVDFYSNKESYQENFNNYQEIEQYKLKWISGIRNKCVKLEYGIQFISIHVMEEHTLCVCAKDMNENEIPFR